MKILVLFNTWVEKACRWGLVLCVAGMLGLTLWGVVFRWLGMSWLWIDPMVRHIVLLATFLGGVLAVGKGQHIAIDLYGKHLAARKNWRAFFLHKKCLALISSGTIFWFAWASWPFAASEWQYGRPDFLGIHSGLLVSIIPFGFILLGVRFFLVLFLPAEVPAPRSRES